MFRTLFVAAFVAAATATTWPMITVNSAGEIVLNSVSRASSFQLTASAVTAGPTTSTTASLTTVTALDDNVDTYIVSVPTTLATSGGFKLPTPSVGRKVTLFNDGTAPAEFTVWTSATTVFFGTTTSTTHIVPSTATWTTFTATDTTNWAVTSSESASKVIQTIGTGSAAAITLTANELLGGFYTFTGTAASTITTPTGSALEAANVQARAGDSFEFTLHNTGTATATLTAGASGITFSDNGDVDAGSRVSFRVIRTAASAYSIWRKENETGKVNVVTTSAALNAASYPSKTIFVVNAAISVTLPSCSGANVGLSYMMFVSGVAGNGVFQAATNDYFVGGTRLVAVGVDTTAGAAAGTLTLGNTKIVAAGGGATSGAYGEVTCIGSNIWIATAVTGGTNTAVA